MRTRSNNNFYDSDDLSTILRLSMKLCGKETTSVRRSRTPVQYWNRMFRLWRTKTSVIGYNVVYAALYCTHWGTYPVDMPSKPELRMLVDLVRRQFERVNADMKCAKEHFFFSTSLNDVLNSDSPHLRSSIRWTSACYRAFLMAKTQYKLYGAFYEIDNLNLLTTSVEEFVDMKSAAETRQLYETVKGYIVKLIPCASTWSDDQFSNDAAIIMHLKNLYKIDYIECPDSFDSLIKAFDAIDADEDVEHRLLVVGDMTLALAKVIWPYETEKQIENSSQLTEASCRRETPYGVIEWHWYADGDGFSGELTVPEGTECCFRTPDGTHGQILAAGTHLLKWQK